MKGCELGLFGLGTMGAGLALNLIAKGHRVAVFNRTAERTKALVASIPRELRGALKDSYSLEEFLASLEEPKKILLMVTAGPAVDQVLDALLPRLSEGSVVMDGGNSHFRDTERRLAKSQELRIHYLGVGISGGEEGAKKGACLMVGGGEEGYELVEGLLKDVAADLPEGKALAYLGGGGAGHLTKMVHNGIEYALMQGMAEAYDLLRTGLGWELESIAGLFERWSKGSLASYLMEICVEVLRRKEEDTPLLELILDKAGQKGTGRWTSELGLELGVPIPTIDAAVAARNLSGLKEERVRASGILRGPRLGVKELREEAIADALYCTFLVSYAQGLELLASSRGISYSIPIKEVVRIWRAGCVIRSSILEEAWRRMKEMGGAEEHLLLVEGFPDEVARLQEGWREVVAKAKLMGIPCPAMASALDYYDGYRRGRLPAHLIQALRDRFGSHGYERIDRPGQYHTQWL